MTDAAKTEALPLPVLAAEKDSDLTGRYIALLPERQGRVTQYVDKLRSYDRGDLLSYAMPEQQRAVAFARKVIEQAERDETTDTDLILQQVHAELKGFNPEEFMRLNDKAWYELLGLHKVPFVHGFCRWLSEQIGLLPAYLELLKKYQATSTRIASLKQKLEEARLDAIRGVKESHGLFEESMHDLRVFEDALLAAELYLKDIEAEIKKLKTEAEDNPDISLAARITRIEGRLSAFERQIDDMASCRNIISQQIVMFEHGASTDADQVHTIGTLITHGISLFETMTASIVLGLRRRKRGRAISATRKGIAEMVKRSTAIQRETIVGSIKQIEDGNFDIDAIEEGFSHVTAMLSELNEIREQAKVVRSEKRQRLDKMMNELVETLAHRERIVKEDASLVKGDGA